MVRVYIFTTELSEHVFACGQRTIVRLMRGLTTTAVSILIGSSSDIPCARRRCCHTSVTAAAAVPSQIRVETPLPLMIIMMVSRIKRVCMYIYVYDRKFRYVAMTTWCMRMLLVLVIVVAFWNS